jgi:hypothetical protein
MYGANETNISTTVVDQHRLLVSLCEELEAVDWYTQRIDASSDKEIKSVLTLNRDDEIEHAARIVELLRKKFPGFEKQLKREVNIADE